MNPTETIKYGDKVTAGYAPGQSGLAVYDPKTGTALSGAQKYNPNTGQAITSELLKATENLKLPNATTPTFGGLGGATEAVTTQAKTDQQIALDQAKGNVDTSLKDLLQETLNQGSISSSVDRTQQDAAQKEVNNFTSQLEQEQLANRRAIEAIQNAPGLATAEQRGAEAADVNRKSLSKQADIAILQSAANRNYDTAASIADRAVAMKLEQSNARLSALKLFYDDNKATFNKQEDRQYQEKIKEQERELKKKEEFEKTVSDIKLNVAQSDAPNKAQLLSSLSTVTSVDEALKVAGQYSGDYLKAQLLKEQIKTERAQRSKIYNDINASKGTGTLKQEDVAKAIESKTGQKTLAAKDLVSQLSGLSALYEKYGARPTSAEGIGAIESARASAQLAVTAAFGQGAISEGDRASYSQLTGSTFGIAPTAKLNQAIETQKKNYKNNLGVLNDAYPGITSISSFSDTNNSADQNSKPNKFQQASGQTNQTFNTAYLNVKPDGSLDWSLPGVTK